MRDTIGVSPGNDLVREQFFREIYGDDAEGFFCISIGKSWEPPHRRGWIDRCFRWPDDLEQGLAYIDRHLPSKDIYFCPQLLTEPKRRKEYVAPCRVLWADLDTCPPNLITPLPSIVVQTSANRTHAYWLLKEHIAASDAADICHRLAYHYEHFGADTGGWDLSQVLRVPLTYNHKRRDEGIKNVVEIDSSYVPERYGIDRFADLPQVKGYEYVDIPLPDLNGYVAKDILERYRPALDVAAFRLFEVEPEGSWSEPLWRLERLLFESGMTREEVFAVVQEAAPNKYERDHRSIVDLWREVGKAEAQTSAIGKLDPDSMAALKLSPLLESSERKQIKDDTFLDRFAAWGTSQTDAVPEYFIAGGVTILSALLSGNLKLPVSDSTIVPNIWFMVLGDTTTSRKTTVMNIAMSILDEVDEGLLLATDGSIEGLLTAIQSRASKPGIFHRDEFSGMLSAMQKKQYLSGISEDLCRLYDGSRVQRVLRGQTVTIRHPVFLLFTGGVPMRILELLDKDAVMSGFIPRFLFADATGQRTTFRPTTPPTIRDDKVREALVEECRTIKQTYDQTVLLANTTPVRMEVTAEGTPEFWERFQKFEVQVYEEAETSAQPELFKPTFARLSRSTLKVAMLIAAARQTPQDSKVMLEVADLLKALSYAERWRENAVNVVEHAGETLGERMIQTIFREIQRAGDRGIMRSVLMQHHHLTRRVADEVFDTLFDRGVIRKAMVATGKGRPGERYFAVSLGEN